ncbi:MAG: O-methyltransferase [Desulfobaccales bacterium]
MAASKHSALHAPAVTRVLDRLFQAAEETDPAIVARLREEMGKTDGPVNDSERAELLGEAFLPVSREMGQLLYILARAQRSRNIVEFGTSFGISTIFLAAALRDNGGGRVITTEMNGEKVKRARQHLDAAGLGFLVEFRAGDALVTLRDLEGPIDLVLLDGWKNLYLPVLQLVEPHLRQGALIIADDLDIFPEAHKPYLEYVRRPENGYLSVEVPLGDRIEVSLRNIP